MNTDNTYKSEPSVPREELLSYLLDQCDESRHCLRLGFPFQILGLAVLYYDEKFFCEYQEIHRPGYTLFDRLRTYQRLFTQALVQIKDTPVGEVEYPKMPDYWEATNPDICKEFLATAMRDGRAMLDTGDFRFLSVFPLTSWLGLRYDEEGLADFETRCFGPDMEQRDKIKVALGIIEKAL